MKTTDEFLFDLTKRDIKIWIDKGQLCINAPKGAITPEIHAELQERKSEIMQFLHTSEQAAQAKEPIHPVKRTENMPLSFAQQRLWFLDQLEGGGPAYNIPVAFKMRGRFHKELLDRCLSEIVARHEILRTVFPTVNGMPVQKILPANQVNLDVVDLSHLPPQVQEDTIAETLQNDASRPFDLADGPLWRTSLLKLDEETFIFSLAMHHIISDGWSMGIFVREVTTLYAAYVEQKAPQLEGLSIQYVDFAVWQRNWLTGDVLERQIEYWRSKLSGAPPVLELPTDRPRPAVQTFAGGIYPFELGPELSQLIRTSSEDAQITLLMYLLAAYAILLARYSNQTDLVIGTPIANRSRRETHPIIGFFLNTLALRINLDGNPTVEEMLARVKHTFFEAQTYQDLPFERLVQEVQPERTASYMPLFQVMFVWQHVSNQETITLPDLQVNRIEAENTATKFDLVLAIEETESNISGLMRYKTELFDEETIDRMIQHLLRLIRLMAQNPERRILDLPMLDEAEAHQIVTGWNQTQGDLPRDVCLHQLFEAQARKTPDAEAVVLDGVRLSYAELNDRAERLATYLQQSGVAHGDLVGVCLERSLAMITAVLAIQKCGAAYVPLDPAHPPARLLDMIEDMQPAAIVTQESVSFMPDITDVQLVVVDRDESAIAQAQVDHPRPLVRATDLAYIIYTSGSTGKPKGVMISHQAAVNTVLDINQRFEVGPDDRVLALSELGFDLSVYDIFGPLAAGGAVVLLNSAAKREPAMWAELLERERITIWNSVPALMNLYINFAETHLLAEPETLRVVMLSGDWIPVHLPDRIRVQHPQAGVYSLGGATEGSIWSIIFPIEEVDPEWRSIPYGRPLTNQRFHVLNSQLQPCPVGVVGDLYIGGDGVALGYLNRQKLTAEKFIPDPFAAEPHARLYKTGDLGRYLPDGNIEFLGRRDFQVKIRGFRIELGEIETVLEHYPDVARCVVMAREDAVGEKRLVAYLVAGEEGVEQEELRRYLGTRLPEYMIPAHFVVLEEMPLSDNGKIDRKKLPDPADLALERSVPFEAPRDELETRLAEMWQTVLGRDEISIHDNFFALGGDSLQAAMMANQLQLWLDEMIYVVALFEAATVAELADLLRTQYATAVERALSGGAGIVVPQEPLAAVANREIADLRQRIRLAPRKNRPAVFVLSPPRSGSTLLRVMLGGHPTLFAPPSLEMLPYTTMRERSEHFAAGYRFWTEGLVRAVMQIRRCSADEAQEIVAGWEEKPLTTKECYAQLQDWLGSQILVDKTPSYTFDPHVLSLAETRFENPFYIHLSRHPYGMIHSFEKARTDQVYQVFFRDNPALPGRRLAELLWIISHQNIRSFLTQIPQDRQIHVRYEDLVKQPQQIMEALCERLKIDFHPHMLQPYRDAGEQMTDGIHEHTSMVGDVYFHEHTTIDPEVAERWREHIAEDFLSEEALAIASSMAYHPLSAAKPQESAVDATPDNGGRSLRDISEERRRQETVLAEMPDLDQLSESEIDALLAELLVEGSS